MEKIPGKLISRRGRWEDGPSNLDEITKAPFLCPQLLGDVYKHFPKYAPGKIGGWKRVFGGGRSWETDCRSVGSAKVEASEEDASVQMVPPIFRKRPSSFRRNTSMRIFVLGVVFRATSSGHARQLH